MTTEAGRRLFTKHEDCVGYWEIWGERDALNAIEAEARQQGFDAAWAESSIGIEGKIAEAVAAERARIAEAVRGLAVRKTVKGESDWQNGFRQSRNETVAAVLAIIEPARGVA